MDNVRGKGTSPVEAKRKMAFSRHFSGKSCKRKHQRRGSLDASVSYNNRVSAELTLVSGKNTITRRRHSVDFTSEENSGLSKNLLIIGDVNRAEGYMAPCMKCLSSVNNQNAKKLKSILRFGKSVEVSDFNKNGSYGDASREPAKFNCSYRLPVEKPKIKYKRVSFREDLVFRKLKQSDMPFVSP